MADNNALRNLQACIVEMECHHEGELKKLKANHNELKAHANLYANDDAILCRVFPMFLKGAALTWYGGLLPGQLTTSTPLSTASVLSMRQVALYPSLKEPSKLHSPSGGSDSQAHQTQGFPLVSLAKPRTNMFPVESLKAHQTQGPPLVNLTKASTNVFLVESPKARQTQDLHLVNPSKPKTNTFLVESPKAHQAQGPPLVSLTKPRANMFLVESPKAHQIPSPPLVSLAKPSTNVFLVKSSKAHQTQGLSLIRLFMPMVYPTRVF
ncbi:hypothetical protein JHK87_042833 [Glycine soja]|nr:hypothetical protein JHK87_042833 [Glycine soja]